MQTLSKEHFILKHYLAISHKNINTQVHFQITYFIVIPIFLILSLSIYLFLAEI